ncbi:collagen, type III, alpha 1-like protein [Candidatus Protofrankia datiscae]|uniref:Collagen, type III, alpha 1-like protein n=1 Tax=Candidatus Protofrankia datiscae TaxID=2716812 RepID=F8AVU1_9ACTN|nr:collagen, type III, alpha 1-like protein [Candidatus Protofrankia datiscae]
MTTTRRVAIRAPPARSNIRQTRPGAASADVWPAAVSRLVPGRAPGAAWQQRRSGFPATPGVALGTADAVNVGRRGSRGRAQGRRSAGRGRHQPAAVADSLSRLADGQPDDSGAPGQQPGRATPTPTPAAPPTPTPAAPPAGTPRQPGRAALTVPASRVVDARPPDSGRAGHPLMEMPAIVAYGGHSMLKHYKLDDHKSDGMSCPRGENSSGPRVQSVGDARADRSQGGGGRPPEAAGDIHIRCICRTRGSAWVPARWAAAPGRRNRNPPRQRRRPSCPEREQLLPRPGIHTVAAGQAHRRTRCRPVHGPPGIPP